MATKIKRADWHPDQSLIVQRRRHNVVKPWGEVRKGSKKRPTHIANMAGWPIVILPSTTLSKTCDLPTRKEKLKWAKKIYSSRKAKKIVWTKWEAMLRDGIPA